MQTHDSRILKYGILGIHVSEDRFPKLSRYFLTLSLTIFFFTGQAQSRLPDITGDYYFSGDQLILSHISSPKTFTLKSTKSQKRIKVLRLVDRIEVVDVVTYFADAMVTDSESNQSRRTELILVENKARNRIRIELENGEEWIRESLTSARTQPVRRE